MSKPTTKPTRSTNPPGKENRAGFRQWNIITAKNVHGYLAFLDDFLDTPIKTANPAKP